LRCDAMGKGVGLIVWDAEGSRARPGNAIEALDAG
jgi:hypothetical protein